jgi:uncharacterized protein YjbI with pentapeptide repeats
MQLFGPIGADVRHFLGSTLDKKTRFRKTDLTDVSFLGSKAKYAKFDSATLCRTILPDGAQDDWGCPENAAKIRRTGDPEANRKKLIQTGACHRCNLAGIDLSGVELECPDLSEADLTDANLSGAIFRRPKPPEGQWYSPRSTMATCVDFTRALLTGSRFNGATMEVAEFTGASIGSVNFSDSTLWGAIFQETTFKDVELSGADLAGARFIKSNLDNVDFRGARTSKKFTFSESLVGRKEDRDARIGLVFMDCSMMGAKFGEVTDWYITSSENPNHLWEHAVNLSNAVFEKELPVISLGNAGGALLLRNVDLSNRKLEGLSNRKLGGAPQESRQGIVGASRIDFSGADLSGTDFGELSFSQVILTDACLVGAKPFGFYHALLGNAWERDDINRKSVICRTQFSWGEESINCRSED